MRQTKKLDLPAAGNHGIIKQEVCAMRRWKIFLAAMVVLAVAGGVFLYLNFRSPTLHIVPGSVTPTGASFTLRNRSWHPLGFSHAFRLERLTDNGWELIEDVRWSFPIAQYLGGFGSYEFDRGWNELAPGEYRLIKAFCTQPAMRRNVTLTAPFTIDGGSE